VKHIFSVGDRVISASVTFPATGIVIDVNSDEDDVVAYTVEWESDQYRTSYQEFNIGETGIRPAPR